MASLIPGLPIPLPFPSGGLALALPIVLVIVGFMAAVVWIVLKYKKRARGDLAAVVLDDRNGQAYLIYFTRLSDKIYVSVTQGKPIFLMLPPWIRIYESRFTGLPMVVARISDMFAVPLDPKLTEALSTLLATEEYRKLREEDVSRLVYELYRLEGSKTGRIRVTYPTSVAFSFDTPKIITDIVDRYGIGLSEYVSHFLGETREMDKISKLIRSLTGFISGKYQWILYIGALIFILFLGLGIFMMLTAMHPPIPAAPPGGRP